ncbi:MAG: thiamine phosphate synthase [Actinomycetia bacterium]|nr:thiamine phosphate synthase [Actinomycetes bacterium]
MLVAVVDGSRLKADWLERARAAAPAVDVVVLRVKDRPAREQWEMARALVAAAAPRPVLVADRLDVAQGAGAAGVHLPEAGLPAPVARRLWPRGLIAQAVHGVAGVDGLVDVDWLVFGHLFPTRSHPGEPARGLEAARPVKAAARVPVVGIGGITAANAGAVRAAGLDGIAVVDALWEAPDPLAAARALRTAFGGEGEAGHAAQDQRPMA